MNLSMDTELEDRLYKILIDTAQRETFVTYKELDMVLDTRNNSKEWEKILDGVDNKTREAFDFTISVLVLPGLPGSYEYNLSLYKIAGAGGFTVEQVREFIKDQQDLIYKHYRNTVAKNG